MAYEIESPIIDSTLDNNVRARADQLLSGELMFGNLGSANDLDYYVVTTDSAGLIKLDFGTSLLTTTKYFTVRILDGNGDLLYTTESSVAGSPKVNGTGQAGTSLVIDGITKVPAAGTLFHFATSGEDTSVYTVVSATALSAGETTLTLDKALPASLPDNTPLVFDSARLLTGVSTSITAVAPAAGSYYVQVSAGDVYSGASYDLLASVLPTVEKEGTGGNGSATGSASQNLAAAVDAGNRLLENITMTGALSSATDVDCWVFTTAVSSDFDITFASGTSSTSDEWKIEITDANGAVLSGGSLSAGTSTTLSVAKATFPTGKTFLVKVSATSGEVYNLGNYSLRVSGADLDLNDAPVLTVGGVSGSTPNLPITSGVTRSVAAGNTSGIALTDWFTAVDPDSAQTVAYYRLSLTKDDATSSDAVIEVGSGNAAKTYGFAAGALASASVVLTGAEMASAVFKPGTTAAGAAFTFTVQAYDSTSTLTALGGVDSSGASSIISQSVRVVSANAGVSTDTSATKLDLSENLRGQGADKPHETSFSLVLNEAPTAEVKVYLVDSNNQIDLKVNGSSSELVTFTTSNWATAQTVSVAATSDSTLESSQSGVLSFTMVSDDPTYDGFSLAPLTFTIYDNAAPALTTPQSISYTDTSANDSFASVSGTLSATDANGDAITFGIQGGTESSGVVTSTNTFGTLEVTSATGAYTFTPSLSGLNAAASQSSKTFSVTATDGAVTSSGNFTISVAGVNDKPTGNATVSNGVTESSGAANAVKGTLSATASLSLLDAETSAAIDTSGLLSEQWVASSNGSSFTKVGTYGAATLNLGASQVTYTLNDSDPDTQALKPGQIVSDIFSLPIKDTAGLTNTVSVAFSVTGANDFPVISSVVDQGAAVGTLYSLDIQKLVNDPEGDAVTLTVTREDGSALPSWLAYDTSSKTLSGTPALADQGSVILRLTAGDGTGTTEGYFNLLVTDASLQALLREDVISVPEDTPASGNVLTNDLPASGIPLEIVSFSLAGSSAYSAGDTAQISGVGSIVLSADGSYVFTPEPNFFGTVPTITYQASFEQGSSTLAIGVTAVDDASVLQADTADLLGGNLVTGNVLANDSDIDSVLTVAWFLIAGDQTVQEVGKAVNIADVGTLTLMANGDYSFLPTQGFVGSVPLITYTTNTNSSSTLRIGAGTDVMAQAYHWNNHGLLENTSITLTGQASRVTDGQGSVTFEGVTDEQLTMTVSREESSASQASLNASVSLSDAIAILKMIVGLDVNTDGRALSPYQALAADFDGNGVVQLTDAIGVLKHVVGLEAPTVEWRFVDELQGGLTTGLNVGEPPAIERSLDITSSSVKVGIVGFVAGDVDGSFQAPEGTAKLDTAYFTDLVAQHSGLSLTQFGIYN